MKRLPCTWCRFNVRSLLIFTLGIAIGYALHQKAVVDWFASFQQSRSDPLALLILEPSDILEIEAEGQFSQAYPTVAGPHLIGPDGTVNLGSFGSQFVAGMTIDQAERVLRDAVTRHVPITRFRVSVHASYGNEYSVVVLKDRGICHLSSFPFNGNETVLDAARRVEDAAGFSNPSVWVIRDASNGSGSQQVVHVDWDSSTGGSSNTSSVKVFPKDRIFISE